MRNRWNKRQAKLHKDAKLNASGGKLRACLDMSGLRRLDGKERCQSWRLQVRAPRLCPDSVNSKTNRRPVYFCNFFG
jgi:hypothetical protein